MRSEQEVDDADFKVLLGEARRMTALEFAQAHGELFLLVQRSTLRSQTHFETDVSTRRGSVPPMPGNMEISVLPIRKSSRSPYQDRISIGRARNCDVVIRDASVSKLQAYVFTGVDGSLAIVDVGSQNGTRIGARQLIAHKPASLKAGDVLTLGAVVATALDATSAYSALVKLLESFGYR